METSSLSVENEISLLSKVLSDVEIGLKTSKGNSLRLREKLKGFKQIKAKLQAKLEPSLNVKTTLEINIGKLLNEIQRSKELLAISRHERLDIVQSVPKVKSLFEIVENLENVSKESRSKLEERKIKLNEVSYSEVKEEVEWKNQRRILHDQNEKHERMTMLDTENKICNYQKFLAEIERLENETQGIIDVAAQVVKGLAGNAIINN